MDIDNYSYDFEDRRYLNPETSRDEQMGFIDTLRDMQAQNNEQIQTQTHNLGRDITPDLGGLSGSGGYFQGRYQTPQTNALVSDLKSAAQLSALNQVLSNMQAQAKQRYTKAQQDYQKRQYDKANNSGGGGGTPAPETPATPDDGTTDPEINLLDSGTLKGAVGANIGALSKYGDTTTMERDGYVFTYDSNNNVVNTDDPSYVRGDDGYMHPRVNTTSSIQGLTTPLGIATMNPWLTAGGLIYDILNSGGKGY